MLHLISVKYLCSLFGLEVAQQQLIYRNLFRSCFDSKYERFFYCIPHGKNVYIYTKCIGVKLVGNQFVRSYTTKERKKQLHSLDLSFLFDFSCNSVSFSIAFMSSLANEVKKINDYQMNMSVAFGFTAQFGKSD